MIKKCKCIPIIVLNYNDLDTTSDYVERMITDLTNTIYKIIVVDNFSTDNSFDELSRKFANFCDVVRTDKNGGYSYGNNYGLRYAVKKYDCDYVVISNPDVFVTHKQLDAMNKAFKIDEKVKIVGCKMLDHHGQLHKYGWKMPSYLTELLTTLVLINKIFAWKMYEYPKSHFKEEFSYVDVVCGSLFMGDIKALHQIGYFDDHIFLYGEEQILGAKLKKFGYKELVLNEVTFVHKHGESIKKSVNSRVSRFLMHQKSKRYYLKEYLNINAFELIIFDLFTMIGKYERKIFWGIKGEN